MAPSTSSLPPSHHHADQIPSTGSYKGQGELCLSLTGDGQKGADDARPTGAHSKTIRDELAGGGAGAARSPSERSALAAVCPELELARGRQIKTASASPKAGISWNGPIAFVRTGSGDFEPVGSWRSTAAPNSKRMSERQSNENCSICHYLASIQALTSDKQRALSSRKAREGIRSSSCCQEGSDYGADKVANACHCNKRRSNSLANQREVEYEIQNKALIRCATVRPQSARSSENVEQLRLTSVNQKRTKTALKSCRGFSLDDRHLDCPSSTSSKQMRFVAMSGKRSTSSKSLSGKLIVISSNRVSYAIQGK